MTRDNWDDWYEWDDCDKGMTRMSRNDLILDDWND